jgi:putative colanic acid biosynthesis glycosyltransferase
MMVHPDPGSRIAPLFTIITVTLDDCEGLQRTHRSIRGQTCQDFDWIVVDGGSRDGTLE